MNCLLCCSEASVLDDFPVAVGANRTPVTMATLPNSRATCILCQEEQDIVYNDRALVLSALVQR